MNTPKTETNNLQYLHEMIEKSKTQKKVMEGEISSAREQIVSLQAQIQQIDQSITLKKSQMDEIDNFVSAADMVLEQVAKIEPVLLRAGIVAVPVQSGNDGTKKMRPLSHQIVMSETLVLMQRKRTEEEDFKGVHLTEIHKYLEEKHGLTLDKQSIYATLTQQAKKPDSQLKYLGQATWTLKGKAGRMNGAALAHAASHRTAAIA